MVKLTRSSRVDSMKVDLCESVTVAMDLVFLLRSPLASESQSITQIAPEFGGPPLGHRECERNRNSDHSPFKAWYWQVGDSSSSVIAASVAHWSVLVADLPTQNIKRDTDKNKLSRPTRSPFGHNIIHSVNYEHARSCLVTTEERRTQDGTVVWLLFRARRLDAWLR